MNQLLLNGNSIQFPLDQQCQFSEMIRYLRGQIDPSSALISSVRIDGNEVPNTEDSALGSTPISHFERIEIFTSHPKQVVQDTLQDLIEFSQVLEGMAAQAAGRTSDVDFPVYFNRLLDGIGTFTEAVSSVKGVLKLGLFNSIQVLESQLLNILQNILIAHQQANSNELARLLSEELPANLKTWRETGLPSLIRSRDS